MPKAKPYKRKSHDELDDDYLQNMPPKARAIKRNKYTDSDDILESRGVTQEVIRKIYNTKKSRPIDPYGYPDVSDNIKEAFGNNIKELDKFLKHFRVENMTGMISNSGFAAPEAVDMLLSKVDKLVTIKEQLKLPYYRTVSGIFCKSGRHIGKNIDKILDSIEILCPLVQEVGWQILSSILPRSESRFTEIVDALVSDESTLREFSAKYSREGLFRAILPEGKRTPRKDIVINIEMLCCVYDAEEARAELEALAAAADELSDVISALGESDE